MISNALSPDPPPVLSSFLFLSSFSSFKLLLRTVKTGTDMRTLTFFPFCSPGIHAGISSTNFNAASSIEESTERTILALVIFPSFSTINWIIGCCCTPPAIDVASETGILKYCIILEFPPGNKGITSAESRTCSSIF